MARRARQQIDEMLAKYGSGQVALSAIHTICPSLISALQASSKAINTVLSEDGEIILNQQWAVNRPQKVCHSF